MYILYKARIYVYCSHKKQTKQDGKQNLSTELNHNCLKMHMCVYISLDKIIE